MAYTIVLVTLESEEDAVALVNTLLEKRLAAGVNVLTGVRTAYWWQGRIESGEETLLLIRTLDVALPQLAEAIRMFDAALEVAPIRITEGNPEFETWIIDTVKRR